MTKFVIPFCIIWIFFSGIHIINIGAGNQYHHPLDPLTAEEIEASVVIIRATRPNIQHEGKWVLNLVTLKEPEKNLLFSYYSKGNAPPIGSSQIPRKSFTILIEKQRNIINEVVVNLDTRKVETWEGLPSGTQAGYTSEENDDCELIALEDTTVQARCHELGWNNMSSVVADCWGVGYREDRPALPNAIRPATVYLYGIMIIGDNQYAHPFDLLVSVDLAARKVILIENLPTHSDYNADNRIGNVCPRKVSIFNSLFNPANSLRTDVNPIYFSQPGGAGYKIRGNEVSWQKFNFRVGFDNREGLSLHQMSYQDGDERRPLFYRMSIGELFVPYADARPPFHQKFAFDMGEWNLRLGAVDIKAAGLCRGGTVSYFSYYLTSEKVEAVNHPNVICIYEKDNGILWAHETREGPVVHTRSLRLSISIMINMGNYDYLVSWKLYQHAKIEFQSELFGSLSAQLLAVNVTNAGGFGTVVAEQIKGQYHQHHLAIRLDAEIDGNSNTVFHIDIVRLPEPSGSSKNPYGNGFTTLETILKTASEARTNISPLTGRSWLVRNPNKIHEYTQKTVSWKLIPYNAPPVLVRKDSPMHHWCAFTDYNVWVTKYKEDQMYPGGFYENGTGLPEWVEEDPNADVTNTDIVLWYIYGFTHIPLVEDYPTMPLESSGFVLKPTNFFLENPSLDVPPPPKAAS